MKRFKNIETPAAAEALWIEQESLRKIAAKALQTTLFVILILHMLTLLIYFNSTSKTALVVWYLFGLLVSAWRLVAVTSTQSHASHKDNSAAFVLLKFFTGLMWGSFAFVFFDKVPANVQTLCMLITLGIGIFTMTMLYSHLPSFYLTLSGYATGLLICILFQISVVDSKPIFENYWILGLVVVYIYILKTQGHQMHLEYTKSLQTQYHNAQLIKSLTVQSQTAMEAVSTKNRFFASAAHDMRQPVLALDIYAEWLDKEPNMSAVLSPKIALATKSVTALFDSMFDMARIAEGQVKVEVSTVNLRAFFENLAMQYRPILLKKNLFLRIHVIDGEIQTDPTLLNRVLWNLISNASKFTSSGGILVACRNKTQGCRIEVWDTGIGIAADEQELIFEEFYKSKNNPGTSEGFGLGLAIVSEIASLLNGSMSIKSAPGKGTVMALQLNTPITPVSHTDAEVVANAQSHH
jgi:signal transduction histidine kinase